MSYVAREQKHWLHLLYGGDDNLGLYQDLLDNFARLVETHVLPAEKNTETERAKNPFREVRLRMAQKAQYDRDALEAVLEGLRADRKIPAGVYDRVAESGLTGLSFDEKLGGMGLPFPLFIACLEILGKASPSVGVRYAISNTVAEGLRFNWEAGRLSPAGERVLRHLVAGEKLAAFCLTEGAVSGSNILKEMTTRAEPLPKGGGYRITGSKMWITNAETADVYAVFARMDGAPEGQDIALFLVDAGTPGLHVGQVFEKRTVENSSLGELVFDGVEVEADRLVGQPGGGGPYAVRMLNSGRITIAALATGLAQRAFDEYLEVGVEGKKTQHRHLAEFERTQAKIAHLVMELNAARSMTWRAAALKKEFDADPDDQERLRDYVLAANTAKLKASLVAQSACTCLVQIWGASAVVLENRAMKHFLDSWLYYFGEAVPEVLENTVAHMAIKEYRERRGL